MQYKNTFMSPHCLYKQRSVQTDAHKQTHIWLGFKKTMGLDLQSHFSLASEDIYKEADHYSCNPPTNNVKKKKEKNTIKERATKEKEMKEVKERRGGGQMLDIGTWHRRSVRSGRGQRSAVSNPPCPLLWTWTSTAPSLPRMPEDTTPVNQSERLFCTADEGIFRV